MERNEYKEEYGFCIKGYHSFMLNDCMIFLNVSHETGEMIVRKCSAGRMGYIHPSQTMIE